MALRAHFLNKYLLSTCCEQALGKLNAKQDSCLALEGIPGQWVRETQVCKPLSKPHELVHEVQTSLYGASQQKPVFK